MEDYDIDDERCWCHGYELASCPVVEGDQTRAEASARKFAEEWGSSAEFDDAYAEENCFIVKILAGEIRVKFIGAEDDARVNIEVHSGGWWIEAEHLTSKLGRIVELVSWDNSDKKSAAEIQKFLENKGRYS